MRLYEEYSTRDSSPLVCYVPHEDPSYHQGPWLCTGSLCQLPIELQFIIAACCNQPALAALARTCRNLSKVAIEALYSSVVVKDELSMSYLTRLTGAPWHNEVMKATRNFEAFLPWHPPDWAEPQMVFVLDHMTSLKHLKIVWDYCEEDEGDQHLVYLPSKLASTLTSCSLSFTCFARWPLEQAVPLFKHELLKILDIHWAQAPEDVSQLTSLAIGGGVTALETLNLIDCEFFPSSLSWMLEFPTGLKHLSVASDSDNDSIWREQPVDHGDYFRAIRDSPSLHTLQGLRFDMTHRAWVIVPAPGMHELTGIRYLETCEEHIERVQEAPHEEFPLPDIECSFEYLFPPNLEVLKITPPFTTHSRLLWDLIAKMESDIDYLPRLRRIILAHHYRDEAAANELREAARVDKDKRNYCRAMYEENEGFPVWTEKPPLENLRLAAAQVSVEIMPLYADMGRKEVFREGAGPAVWEIPEQITTKLLPESAAILLEIQKSWDSNDTEVKADETGEHEDVEVSADAGVDSRSSTAETETTVLAV